MDKSKYKLAMADNNPIRYISVPNKTKVELRKTFKCSKVMVWYALNYKSDSDLAQKIRKLAIAKGGVIFDESNQKFTKPNA